MSKELSASEAVFGFCGWLTSRKKQTVMSSIDDSAVVSDLVKSFCDANKLEVTGLGWENKLLHPVEED